MTCITEVRVIIRCSLAVPLWGGGGFHCPRRLRAHPQPPDSHSPAGFLA